MANPTLYCPSCDVYEGAQSRTHSCGTEYLPAKPYSPGKPYREVCPHPDPLVPVYVPCVGSQVGVCTRCGLTP